MLCPEAATSPAHRAAIESDAPTDVTRAFTGRRARGIVNRFMREHEDAAPSAYPEIHHLTQPLRRAAREAGDPDRIHLWARPSALPRPPHPPATSSSDLAAERCRPVRRLGPARRPVTPVDLPQFVIDVKWRRLYVLNFYSAVFADRHGVATRLLSGWLKLEE